MPQEQVPIDMVNVNIANKTESKSDMAYKGGHVDKRLVGDVGHSVQTGRNFHAQRWKNWSTWGSKLTKCNV